MRRPAGMSVVAPSGSGLTLADTPSSPWAAFRSSRLWVVRQYLRIVLYAAAFFWLLQYSASWVVVALQGVLMACMWQQCGGLMHDYGHTTLGQTRDKDWIGGWLAGTYGVVHTCACPASSLIRALPPQITL